MRTLDLGPNERLIDAPNDTIIVDSGAGIDHGINTQLLSPEITPEPEPLYLRAREPSSPLSTPTDLNTTRTDLDKSDSSKIPTTRPNKGIDKNLILPTNCRRQIREAYTATLTTLYYNSIYYIAFATRTKH